MTATDGIGSRVRWGRLVAEGVAIIASILLAFAIDAWWDERSVRVEEQEVLRRLSVEFKGTSQRLDFYIDFERRTLRDVSAVDSAIQGAIAAARETVPVADSSLGFALSQGTYSPILPSFDALRSSGRMTILSDDELVRALSAWPGVVADVMEHQGSGRQYVIDHVLPVLASAGNLRGGNAQILARFGQPTSGFGGQGETDIKVTQEVAGVVGYRVVLLNASILGLREAREQLSTILELLESAGR